MGSACKSKGGATEHAHRNQHQCIHNFLTKYATRRFIMKCNPYVHLTLAIEHTRKAPPTHRWCFPPNMHRLKHIARACMTLPRELSNMALQHHCFGKPIAEELQEIHEKQSSDHSQRLRARRHATTQDQPPASPPRYESSNIDCRLHKEGNACKNHKAAALAATA